MLTIQPLPYVQGHSSRDAVNCEIFEELSLVESNLFFESELLSLSDEERKSLLKKAGFSDEIYIDWTSRGISHKSVYIYIYMGQCPAESPFWLVFQVFKFFDFP